MRRIAVLLALAPMMAVSATASASTLSCNGFPAQTGTVRAINTECHDARQLTRKLLTRSVNACADPWGYCRYTYWADGIWITLPNGDLHYYRRRWRVRLHPVATEGCSPQTAYRARSGGHVVRFTTDFDCA